MIKLNRHINSWKVVTYTFLIVLTLISLYPLYFTFISSFKTVSDYTFSKMALPDDWIGANYHYVFRNMKIINYILNSLVTVGAGMVLYLFVCNAAGFALGLLRFRFRMIIFSIILFMQIFPQMVIAAQVFRICTRIGLMDSRLGLLLAWVAYFAPFGTYIMSTYYAAMPHSLIESARIDGTNVFQQLFLIMMPMAKPMISTIMIVGSLAMWTELPFSLLLIQSPSKRPLSLGIAILKGEHGVPVPILTAAILVSLVIPLLFYFFLQKAILMESTDGAVKG